jgi:hypothetical protein
MANQGRPKHPAGLRLYNQKYYTVRVDENGSLIYLKKVYPLTFRNTEEHASPPPKTTTSSAPSTRNSTCKTAYHKTQDNSINELNN